MSEPIATWNPARGAWETPVLNLLCGHLEPFSQTWPRSGSMRNGSVFPRPVPGPVISGGASSSSPGLLPTPIAHEDGKSPEAHLAMRARMPGGPRSTITALAVIVQTLLPDGDLLPTPRASANENRQTKRTPSQEAGNHGLCLAAEMLGLLTEENSAKPGALMPTPRASDGTHGGPNMRGSSGDLMLPSAVVALLTEGGGRLSPDSGSEGLEVRPVEHHGQERPSTERGRRDGTPAWSRDDFWQRPGIFGRYEAAVRRHEFVFGRLVPAPVAPDRKGNPRLSPRFSEWMMNLPGGWVTDVPGLTRNAQITAIGDGVMPQQAAMALRLLLDRADIPFLVAADPTATKPGEAA